MENQYSYLIDKIIEIKQGGNKPSVNMLLEHETDSLLVGLEVPFPTAKAFVFEKAKALSISTDPNAIGSLINSTKDESVLRRLTTANRRTEEKKKLAHLNTTLPASSKLCNSQTID